MALINKNNIKKFVKSSKTILYYPFNDNFFNLDNDIQGKRITMILNVDFDPAWSKSEAFIMSFKDFKDHINRYGKIIDDDTDVWGTNMTIKDAYTFIKKNDITIDNISGYEEFSRLSVEEL